MWEPGELLSSWGRGWGLFLMSGVCFLGKIMELRDPGVVWVGMDLKEHLIPMLGCCSQWFGISGLCISWWNRFPPWKTSPFFFANNYLPMWWSLNVPVKKSGCLLCHPGVKPTLYPTGRCSKAASHSRIPWVLMEISCLFLPWLPMWWIFPVSFQEHMPYFRRKMVWEIIHQQLLGDMHC